MDQYQEYMHLSRYARWDGQRRETFEETINRYLDFFQDRFPDAVKPVRKKLFSYIHDLGVMPSMRALMTSGKALDRDNVAGYNCSYTAIKGEGDTITLLEDNFEDYGFDAPITISIKNPIVFDEILYILMCGVGVGFSVERQYIHKLPVVGKKLARTIYARTDDNFHGVDPDELSTMYRGGNVINVTDSKYGWASALRILIVELYNGNFDITWDLSKLRAAGEPLKTFGGRSSGPEPYDALLCNIKQTFIRANGRKLSSIECHDIVCYIGQAVVVGGVRRSACISLSNLSDQRMREAKVGDWFDHEPQRQLANNSVAYTEKPEVGVFMKEWRSLYNSKSGERGMFNREAANNIAARNGRRLPYADFGTNPCSEIILRMMQFCNLSEVVIREDDTRETLLKKIEIATILGTLQASLTDFVYLNPKWKENTIEEALLGVSLTGVMDNKMTAGEDVEVLKSLLTDLKNKAIQVNKKWADKIGINQAAAITCLKPSGSVSQLVNSASGIHARFAPYYIRTVRNDSKDPLCAFLIDQGVPYEPAQQNTDVTIFSFPVKSPDNSIFTNDRTAIEQLEIWLIYQNYYCEHKPSVTIYVKEEEWLDVQAWVYNHFDVISGISFLPYSDHIYAQAPYQEITKEEFDEATANMPVIDWDKLSEYETEDLTTGMGEFACVGDKCEITGSA